MAVYKKIDDSNITFSENIFHKTQNLSSSDAGVHSQQYVSGANGATGSYWESLRTLFYFSGSQVDGNDSRFNSPNYSLADYAPKFPVHKNKFHSQKSGSVISIGQKNYGETIKRGSFILTDNSTAKEVTIRDDGKGNLYPVGHTISQSSTTSISSSDNYVGNIFYDMGIVTLTATSSYSQSISYSDVSRKNYNIKFDATQTIYNREFEIEINPGEFNGTMNGTIRGYASGSIINQSNESPFVQNQFTGSNWTPYVTQIHLYDANAIHSHQNRGRLTMVRLY